MQEIVQLNDDLEDAGESQNSMHVQKCDNCEDFRHKFLQSREENNEMRYEMTRLTDKLDNIRRL